MRKITALKKFSEKHYYAALIFAFIFVYALITPKETLFRVSEAILAIHAVDFGMGFCSRLLPGAIYNLFFDSVSPAKTAAYVNTLLVIFFIVMSFLLEKLVLSVESGHRKTALIILAFFITGPATFAIHIHYPGMLDMYWVFCALFLFVLLSKKQLTPLIFLPFVLCVTVYFASLICFIPFFVIIVLYKISYSESKKEKAILWSFLIFAALAAVALSIYFAVFENGNLIYTIDEFHEIYSKKGTDRFFYFDQNLYKDVYTYDLEKYATYQPENGTNIELIFGEILLRVNYTFSKMTLSDKLIIFALIAPVFSLVFAFLFTELKYNIKSKNRLKAFANICTIALPFFTLFSSVFFSEDLVRWIGHAFLTLFATFLYLLYKEGKEAWSRIESHISKIPFAFLLIYFTFYATTVYHPYYIG